MAGTSIPLDGFNKTFGTDIELSSVALGGRVVSVSDDFFAEAFHLLLVEPAPSLKGQFGPKGALYSGWESRRHNPHYDWCIIELGTKGTIRGFDIDTSHFNGNEAPEVSVQAIDAEEDPQHDDPRWSEVLQKTPLGPNSRHLFTIPETSVTKYVKLNMYPDGGIARFRVYGLVSPVTPAGPTDLFDLAHVFAGGRVVYTSDQHFGVGSNLILPGRGKDMGDGWETKRSRVTDHKDWAIIKLGDGGYLNQAEIDTAHFKGNFPESCELHAANSSELIPSVPEENWTLVLPRIKLGPHRRHFFQLENTAVKYTHIRLTIYPDGGVKRVRVIGSKEPSRKGFDPEMVSTIPTQPSETEAALSASKIVETVELTPSPLTPEAFASFGKVVQGYADLHAVPRGTKVTDANQGSASKFHKLSLLDASYPSDSAATTGLSVYRCQPIDAQLGGDWDVKLLERHLHTSQAFIPMAGGNVVDGADGLSEWARAYLVIVAKNGTDDKPDLGTLRAFLASAAQGIVYDTGIWHHPMAVLEKPLDLTCVETQIGDGSKLDCEIVDLDISRVVYKVKIPKF